MNSDEEKLFPWEEEVKKKAKGIGCLPEKTNLKCKARSKPNVEGQKYLNLYLMTKEKERLEKFGQVIGRMHRQTAKNWREVHKEMAKAGKTVSSAEGTGIEGKRKAEKTRKRTPKKPMKTIPLNY